MERTSSLDPGASSSAPSSLLDRAKLRDEQAWSKLVQLYGPLVYRWARLSGLQAHDASDVVQEVFATLTSSLPQFRRDRPGDSFRAWLRTITRNKVCDWARRRKARPDVVGGSQANLLFETILDEGADDEQGENGFDTALLHRGLELVRAEFEPHTWHAFWQTAVDGKPPAEVAENLGMAVASVYQAKSRVLRRLRAEFEGLVDWPTS